MKSLVLLALLSAQRSAPVCHLQIVPDYTLGFAYRAVLRLSPACPFDTLLRVRKSSTTSTRRGGAPYQPILPETGAWNLGSLSSSVPAKQLWTSTSWRWEFWNDLRWQAGEVLYARP